LLGMQVRFRVVFAVARIRHGRFLPEKLVAVEFV